MKYLMEWSSCFVFFAVVVFFVLSIFPKLELKPPAFFKNFLMYSLNSQCKQTCKLGGVVKTLRSVQLIGLGQLSIFVLLSVPFDKSLNCAYDIGNSL